MKKALIQVGKLFGALCSFIFVIWTINVAQNGSNILYKSAPDGENAYFETIPFSVFVQHNLGFVSFLTALAILCLCFSIVLFFKKKQALAFALILFPAVMTFPLALGVFWEFQTTSLELGSNMSWLMSFNINFTN